jgi:hypothetical protein
MQRLLIAVLAAAIFSGVLNFGGLERLAQGTLTTEYLNDHGTDERYYLAKIHKVLSGEPFLGNSTLIEHRDDTQTPFLAPAIEGFFGRITGMTLPQTVLFFDVLWAFLFVLLLSLACTRFFRGEILPGTAAALLIATDVGTYFLRASNPQVPLVLTALWLWSLLAIKNRYASLALRAVSVSLLLWAHIVYGSLLLIMEAVLFLAASVEHRSWKRGAIEALVTGGIVAILHLPRLLFSGDPEALTDVFYRLGVLRIHAPTSPKTQAVILAVLLVTLGVWWWKRRSEAAAKPLTLNALLLVSALIGLNQAVIHGYDATFTSYYHAIIRIIVLLSILTIVFVLLPSSRWRTIVFAVFGTGSIVCLTMQVLPWYRAQEQATEVFAESDEARVLEWLAKLTEPAVVAAPRILSERIPSATPHYVLFNEYSWVQTATDREMAERYALQATLLPSAIPLDDSYTSVLGQYAGLTASKTRALCRLKRTLLRTDDACDADARSFIRHPELLPILDDLRIDPVELLDRYHVTWIVTDESQNRIPLEQCRMERRIGRYAIFGCEL